MGIYRRNCISRHNIQSVTLGKAHVKRIGVRITLLLSTDYTQLLLLATVITF